MREQELIEQARKKNGESAESAMQLWALHKSPKEDFFWAHFAADLGSAEGAWQVGLAYAEGNAVAQNRDMAFAYCEYAMRKGHPEAASMVSAFYESCFFQPDEVDLSDCDQMYECAVKYLDGYPAPRDYVKAHYLLTQTAAAGSIYSKFMLAAMYEKGMGVLIDLPYAMEFYRECEQYDLEDIDERIALMEDKLALHSGDLYNRSVFLKSFSGEDAHGDDVGAMRLALSAERAGFARTAFILSRAYMEGRGLPRNFDEALYYAGKAILNQQYAFSGYILLSTMCQFGYGVDADPQKAAAYYAKAREVAEWHEREQVEKYDNIVDYNRHSITASTHPNYQQGRFLSDGILGQIDIGEAIANYRKAMNDDDVESCIELIKRSVYDLDVMLDLDMPLSCLDHENLRNSAYYAGARNCVVLSMYNHHHFSAFEKLNSRQIRQEAEEVKEAKRLDYLALLMEYGQEVAGMENSEVIEIMTGESGFEDLFNMLGLEEAWTPEEEDIERIPVEEEVEVAKLKERAEDGLPDNLDSYFEGMIGMDSVKAQLDKIYQTVKMQILRNQILVERGMEPIPDEKGYNFILLGNPGTGKTTVARIIAQILYDIKVRSSNSFLEVERSRMISDHIGGTEERMRSILDGVNGGTLFIDEAYALYREDSENDFGQEAIDVLMKDMEDHRNSYSVIMAGYREPMMNMIRNSNTGFSSRFAYTLDLPDYTDEALIEMAHVQLAKNGMQAMDGVDTAIRKCIANDRIDETFGNARYIRELVHRAIENQSERLSRQGLTDQDELFRLRAEDFWQGDLEDKGIAGYLAELDQLVGLASVKEEVHSLINQIIVQEEMAKRGLGAARNLGTLHMAFKGNPGTGKTTVARIIGRLYNELGILKRQDVFVECSRADLVGAHVGETALKVRKAVQSALGGILFIDEAYSLVQNENDSFGLEAVNEIVSLMENNRDNLLVIFAGYDKDIDEFFKNNPGLKSRVPKELHFLDYDLNELNEIALSMIKGKGLVLAGEADAALRMALVKASMQEDFGNARGVRNLIDRMTRNQNVRVALLLQGNPSAVSDEELLTVLPQDFAD